MIENVNMAYLSKIVQEFCQERDWDQFHNPKDLSIGLVTEAAELLEHFRFANESDISEKLSNHKIREEIADELADIFFFLPKASLMLHL